MIKCGSVLFNLCYALERDLKSIFRAGMLKILLQQYRPTREVRPLTGGCLKKSAFNSGDQ